MIEPLTITSAALSILGSLLTVSKALYDQIDGMSNAPPQIKAISTELKDFYSVLGDLKGITVVDDTKAKHDPLGLQVILQHSHDQLKIIKIGLSAYIKYGDETAKTGFLTRLKWPFQANSFARELQLLGSYKQTLQLAFTIFSYKNITSRQQQIEHKVDKILDKLHIVDPSTGLAHEDSDIRSEGQSLRHFIASTAAASSYGDTSISHVNESTNTQAIAESDKALIRLEDAATKWAAQVKFLGDLEPTRDPIVTRTINELGAFIENARESTDDDRALMEYCACSTSSNWKRPPDIRTESNLHKPECYLEQVLNSTIIENELKPLPGFFQQVMYMYGSESKPYIIYFVETGGNRQVFEIADSSALFPIWKSVRTSYERSLPQRMTFFVLATPATPTNDSITAFQTSASMIKVLNNIRNLPEFCRQDTASRTLLQNTVIMLTLGPSISDDRWAALLLEFGVTQSRYTVRPKYIKVQHRSIDIIITRVTDELYHTTNETLLLLECLFPSDRHARTYYYGTPVPALVFVEPKSMKSKASESVWDGIQASWVNNARKAAKRIGYGKQ